MRLNMRHFITTITSFVAIVYIICAAIVLVAPIQTVKFFNLFFHGIDLTKIFKTAILSDVLIGFVLTIIITIIFSALFAYMWNKFYEKMEEK